MSKQGKQGYIYVSYGKEKYLHHAVASALTIRRFDKERPIAIACPRAHLEVLEQEELRDIFQVKYELAPEHCSIVGFKHHLEKFLFFEQNIFLDSDIIWCRQPDTLWQTFEGFPVTITGNETADSFFGASKGVAVLWDVLLRKRRRTLRRFGLSYLSRVQSGVIYAQDDALTAEVCATAREMLNRIDETHFQSRLKESGRTMESCEWSLAMAMSKLNIPVYPWFQGKSSVQLDYIGNYTQHDEAFEAVKCLYYPDSLVYSLRGLKNATLQRFLTRLLTFFGKGDYMYVTPYCLHFGWLHEKQPFLDFVEQKWKELVIESNEEIE